MKTTISSKQGVKIIILAIALVFIASGCSLPKKQKVLSAEEAKSKAEKFINENLLQEGNTAKINDVVEENGLYKMTVEVNGGQKVDSYMTMDGATFFPQAMKVEEIADKNSDTNAQGDAATAQKQEDVPKTDKPVVELFVMSHCPYGTQIEKGIIPAVEALGKKIDFQLKFCDYAMHGEKEVKEQLQQTCIIKEQNDKLFTYLKCFLKEGNSAQCVKDAKIDTKKLAACVAKTDKEFDVIKQLNDKSTWVSGQFAPFNVFAADNKKYDVKGSPALVINGTNSSSSRDAASLLSTICGAFKNKPAECDKKLSDQAPSAGFGEGTGAAAASDAGCAN